MSKLKGFSSTFWIANVIELFERLAYYGSKAILAVFIAERVGLGPEKAGFLAGSVFNTLLYFLPILAGTVVDRYGFKRSLLACFSIFCVGYFLIGLGGLPAGKPLVEELDADHEEHPGDDHARQHGDGRAQEERGQQDHRGRRHRGQPRPSSRAVVGEARPEIHPAGDPPEAGRSHVAHAAAHQLPAAARPLPGHAVDHLGAEKDIER